jgi:hypothetical protein
LRRKKATKFLWYPRNYFFLEARFCLCLCAVLFWRRRDEGRFMLFDGLRTSNKGRMLVSVENRRQPGFFGPW